MSDLISRQAAIDALGEEPMVWSKYDDYALGERNQWQIDKLAIETVPSAQPDYEPVTAEDFAKTMSENSLYNFVAWHQEALTLMKEHGFVICKKTI